MTRETPLLSVVVPVHQGASVLARSLGALHASGFPRARWELIVVDDGSTDGSAAIAATWADQVIVLPGRPHGPAFARNRGVEAAIGAWVMFVDADVAVHSDGLTHIATIIEGDPTVDAIIGAYDDKPEAPGWLSQYRNLLHHYTHLRGRGEADTFWAGCGVVRRSAFVAAEGFDERRYRRPQIEDIELGYRLRDRGYRIVNRPEVQGTHLKRWTAGNAIRTDVWDRGVPWVRLLLERHALAAPSTLNLQGGERLKTALVGLAVVLVLAALFLHSIPPAILAVACLAAVALSNVHQVLWFAQRRGARFAVLVVPMNLWYYLVSGTSVMLALGFHVLGRDGHGSAFQMTRRTDNSTDTLATSFRPTHKAAFGVATGLVAAILVFGATAVTVLRRVPQSDFSLQLLDQYFAGYSITWRGAVIGAAWAAFTGFVMGWFLAFSRNLAFGILLTVVRVRAELAQTRDFLDHI